TIGGAVAVPAGYTLSRRALLLHFGRVPVAWDEQGTLADAFAYTVPDAVTFRVAAWAGDASSRLSSFFKGGLGGSATDLSVPLAAAPQLASPADGAAAVDATTPFRWTQGAEPGVNLFKAIPGDPTDPPFLVVTTA